MTGQMYFSWVLRACVALTVCISLTYAQTSTTTVPVLGDPTSCYLPDFGEGFLCASTGFCISRKYRCDYFDDCGTGEDELGCQANATCLDTEMHLNSILEKCDLPRNSVFGVANLNRAAWTFYSNQSITEGYISEVAFNQTWYGPGLYRMNFSHPDNSLLFFVPENFARTAQTKILRTPERFIAEELAVTIERYNSQTFVASPPQGLLDITVISGDCSAASLDCIVSVKRASMAICDTPSVAHAYISLLAYCPLVPTCDRNQFLCDNIPLCIPPSKRCDGINDCGNSMDERCESECFYGYQFDCISNDTFREVGLFSSNETVPSVMYDHREGETVFIRQIGLYYPGLYTSFEYRHRLNISINSRTEVVYRTPNPEIDSFPKSIWNISLDSNFQLNIGDKLIISWELAPGNPLLFPWQQQNISGIHVRGEEFIGTCENSQSCLRVLPDAFPNNCPYNQQLSFVQSRLEPCFGPPEITYISENVTVRANSAYRVVCIASARNHPGPNITWLVDGEYVFSESEKGLNNTLSVFDVEFIPRETMITCQASVNDRVVSKTVNISVLSSECSMKLDGVQTYPLECLSIEQRTGSEQYYQTVEMRIFSGGLLVNASIRPEYFSGPLADFRVDIKVIESSQQPSKRSLGSLLYSKVYTNILVIFGSPIALQFQPPIEVPSDMMIIFRVIKLSPTMTETDSLRVTAGILHGCSEEEEMICVLDEWQQAVTDSCFRDQNVMGLEESRYFLPVLERCTGITQDAPQITFDPQPILVRNVEDSFHTRCEAQHALRIDWYKKGWSSDIPTNISGTILSFESFEARDQGVFFCVARGGSNYPEAVAVSKPVVVLIRGVVTYLATVRFQYRNLTSVLSDPGSKEHMAITADISNYFLGLYEYGLEDFVVQELRPGSVESDVLLYMYQNANIDDIRGYFSSNVTSEEFSSLQPDGSASSLKSVSFCEDTTFNNTAAGHLTFLQTNIGTIAESQEKCPSYSTVAGVARATARCEGDLVSASYWGVPAIKNCFEGAGMDDNDALDDIATFVVSNPVTEDNVTEVSRDVADATNATSLSSQDLVQVALILEEIVNVRSPSPEVTRNIVEAVDNILDLKQATYDDSVPMKAPTRILQSLEDQLTNLQRDPGNVNFTDIRANVGAVAKRFDQKEFTQPITFGSFFSDGSTDILENLNESDTLIFKGAKSSVIELKAAITLPVSLLDGTAYEESGMIPVTFLIHRTSHLFMSSGSIETEEESQEEVESLIISATVEGEKITDLNSPVVSKFHLLPVEGSTDESARRCVFWNFSLAGGLGGWSSEGCDSATIIQGPSSSVVECNCYHLTNFAILVDVQGDISNIVLDIFSIIGCVVSIIALIITIVTYLAVKKFRSQRPKQILINLCFALLGLYLSFLIGIDRVNLKIGCTIFGALIHFFCLASVAWMCVEAVNMYLLFVKIFDSGVSRFMLKSMAAAWGIPLIVVVTCVIVNPDHFREGYCFPRAGTLTFYIGVLAILAVMLLGNAVCFILVIRQLTCGRSAVGKDQDKRQEVLRYVAISVLLGLTWVFGFLAIGGAQFIFNLLFLIFNSLQGFFIFVFFCLRQEEVRQVWWRWLRCRFDMSDRYRVGKKVTSNSTGDNKSSSATRTDKKSHSTAVDSESIQMVKGRENSNE
ncbi:uncharacterized protein [Apostichopus japonicus]|uniref:uncharacterized protein isoform X2 n=1 Tax=Stichopus japonicus TaxID=307972 RepID=UPI003AB61719